MLPDGAFIERILTKTSLLRLRLDMASSKTTINQTTQKKSGKEHDNGHGSDQRSGAGSGGFVRKRLVGRQQKNRNRQRYLCCIQVELGKPKEQAHQRGLPSSVARKIHHPETASHGLDRSRQHDFSLSSESLPCVGAFPPVGQIAREGRRLE